MQDNIAKTGTNKHTSVRTCVACGKKAPARMLLRVVRGEDGAVAVDRKRRLPGRGAHVCPAVPCLKTAIEKRLFNRAFRTEIPRSSLAALSVLIEVAGRGLDGYTSPAH